MDKPDPKPAAHPTSVMPAESVRVTYRHRAAGNTSRADFLRPDYWQHYAAKLRDGDRIEVIADDNSFYGEYIVLAAGQFAARLAEITFAKIDPVAADREPIVLAGYEIKFNGDQKWLIGKNKQIVKDKFATRAEAHAWLENYLKQAAA